MTVQGKRIIENRENEGGEQISYTANPSGVYCRGTFLIFYLTDTFTLGAKCPNWIEREKQTKGEGGRGFLGEGPNYILSGANKEGARGFEEGIENGVQTGQREK